MQFINIVKDIEKIDKEDLDLNYEIGQLQKKKGKLLHERNKISKGYKKSPYYFIKKWITKFHPNLLQSYEDSISDGQYQSKLWLRNALKNIQQPQHPLHIEIIGGWFGFPLIEMLDFLKIKQIDFYEIDEDCKKVLVQYRNRFKYDFKIVEFGNYFEREELRRRDIIINTSCEHMEDISKMKKYYKNKPLLVLQSNDYSEIDDHINCVQSSNELKSKNEINISYYAQALQLEKYTRYMVIGQW